ncbi:MAG: hypothetical protein WDA09_02370 [Bacteriovoracaceae bacterium]
MKKVKENCPFLNIQKTEVYFNSPDLEIHRSPYLGDYFISAHATMEIENHKEKKTFTELNTTQALINCAYKILTAHQHKLTPYLVTQGQYPHFKENINKLRGLENRPVILLNLEEIMKEKVDHTSKAIALLLEFSKQTQDRHAFSNITPKIQDMIIAKISGKDEFEVILKHLIDEKLINGTFLNGFAAGYNPDQEAPFNDQYSFTMKGWDHIKQEREKTNTNKVFIATQFQWPEDDNLRAEVMDAIKRACDRLGWKADIVSQGHTDFITDRILSEIRSCKFVVAELTYHNRGVYFESGYARGLGKNVFHIVHKDYAETKPEADAESKRMHFDIQQVQYRKWETPEDVEEKLYDWINSTVGKYNEI